MPGHIIDCTPEHTGWREALRMAGIPWHLSALPAARVKKIHVRHWQEALSVQRTMTCKEPPQALLLCGLEAECQGPGWSLMEAIKLHHSVPEIWVWPAGGPCATALCVEALQDGAGAVFASLMGSGGGGRMEEVAAALAVLCGWTLDILCIRRAALATARDMHLRVGDHQAVLGERIFAVESGIHVDGILKDPSTYEPCAPEVFGLTRRFVRGKHNGRTVPGLKLEEL